MARVLNWKRTQLSVKIPLPAAPSQLQLQLRRPPPCAAERRLNYHSASGWQGGRARGGGAGKAN